MWYASARSGASAMATIGPPASATTDLPIRPRNERRLVPRASPSPARGRVDQALELLERVHRPLRLDDAELVHDDDERNSGDVERSLRGRIGDDLRHEPRRASGGRERGEDPFADRACRRDERQKPARAWSSDDDRGSVPAGGGPRCERLTEGGPLVVHLQCADRRDP